MSGLSEGWATEAVQGRVSSRRSSQSLRIAHSWWPSPRAPRGRRWRPETTGCSRGRLPGQPALGRAEHHARRIPGLQVAHAGLLLASG